MASQKHNVLVVIPARGGSKSIPRKNLRKVNGISLVGRAVKIAKSLTWVNKIVLTTDDPEIAEEGRKHGVEVPFLRPPELSGDFAPGVDTWRHAWLKAEEYFGQTFDISILLEPTSPFRKPKHIEMAFNKLVEGGYDSVLTVSETDTKYHPLKQLVIENDRVGYYDNAGKDIIARQQLTTVYYRNGAAYVVTRKCLVDQKTIIGSNASAVVIDEPLVNIDTEQDLDNARVLMSK